MPGFIPCIDLPVPVYVLCLAICRDGAISTAHWRAKPLYALLARLLAPLYMFLPFVAGLMAVALTECMLGFSSVLRANKGPHPQKKYIFFYSTVPSHLLTFPPLLPTFYTWLP